MWSQLVYVGILRLHELLVYVQSLQRPVNSLFRVCTRLEHATLVYVYLYNNLSHSRTNFLPAGSNRSDNLPIPQNRS